MLAIYTPSVTLSVISFETVVPTLTQFRQRIDELCSRLPWLVASDIEGPLG